MFTGIRRRLSRFSPVALMAGVALLAAAVTTAVVLLVRGSSDAEADAKVQPYAARIEKVEGTVNVARIDESDADNADWEAAVVNTPISVGDRIYVENGAQGSIALSANDYVRLNQGATLDVLALDDVRTQLALRGGSALFDCGEIRTGELYEVATPSGAIDFVQPGLYQVGFEDGNVILSVLSGLARVIGPNGTVDIGQGQVLTLGELAAAEAVSSSLSPTLAGGIVDDYYRYRSPHYDGRYANYDTYVSDPFYYDRYDRARVSQYIAADVPGLYELADYGDWQYLNDYGYCWSPRVSAGWAPFRDGYWDVSNVWGPTWVAYESWGWAPYHYGRWSYVSDRWWWVPGRLAARRHYCPAPVTFVPVTSVSQIAWFPLGPGEVYVPRYYDVDWRPHYLATRDVINVVSVQRTFVNFSVPGAVSAVPIGVLGKRFNRGTIVHLDSGVIANARHTIDPFEIQEFRRGAIQDRETRRQLRRAARFERVTLDRAVVASTTPASLSARGDLAKALRVEAVSDRQKGNKLKIRNSGEIINTRRADGLPETRIIQKAERAQRISELSARAERGDRSAQKEMRQLMREQQRAGQAQPETAQQQELRRQMKEERRQRRAGQAGQPNSQVQQGQAQRTPREQELRRQMKQERRQQRAGQAGQAGQARPQDQRTPQQQELRRQTKRQQQQQQQPQQQPRPPKRKPPQSGPQLGGRIDQSMQIQQRRQQSAARQQIERQRAIGQQRAAATQRQQMKAQRRAEQVSGQQQAQRMMMQQRSQQVRQARDAQMQQMRAQSRALQQQQRMTSQPQPRQVVQAPRQQRVQVESGQQAGGKVKRQRGGGKPSQP